MAFMNQEMKNNIGEFTVTIVGKKKNINVFFTILDLNSFIDYDNYTEKLELIHEFFPKGEIDLTFKYSENIPKCFMDHPEISDYFWEYLKMNQEERNLWNAFCSCFDMFDENPSEILRVAKYDFLGFHDNIEKHFKLVKSEHMCLPLDFVMHETDFGIYVFRKK